MKLPSRHVNMLVLVSALLIFPVLLESCCLSAGSCGCGNSEPLPEISVTQIAFTFGNYTADSSTPTPLAKAHFGFRNTGDVVFNEPRRPTMAAYACSLVEPDVVQKITSITAISDREFKAEKKSYAVGESLNELFKANLSNFYNNLAELKFPQSVGWSFELTFDTKITEQQTHNFTFTITLDDGQKFVLNSGNIILIP